MSRLSFVITAIVIALALPSRGFAQEAAYQFTTPPGWQNTFNNGLGLFVPENEPQAGASMLLLPVQPLRTDIENQTLTLLEGVETSMGLSNPQRIPPQRGRTVAGEHVVLAGSYVAKTGGKVYLVVFARADKGALGALVFIAVSDDAYRRYLSVPTAMFGTLRLTDQAAKLAAGSGAKPPAAAQQPPLSQGTAPQPPSTLKPQANGGTPPAEGMAPAHLSEVTKTTTSVSLQDLVGTWVGDTSIRQESISFGTHTDNWGTSYDTTTFHFGTPLGGGGEYFKVRPDGSYEFYHNFLLNGCGTAKYQKGMLNIQNGLVMTRPAMAHETQAPVAKAGACEKYDRDVTPQTDSFKIELSSYDTVYGYPTYRLRLTSATNTASYYVVDRLEARPLPASPPPLTRDYHPGTSHAGRDLQGTWVAPEDTPANFTPHTTPDDGKYRAVLLLFADGSYQMAVRRPNVLYAPVCMKNVTLVEEGEAQFGGKINPNDNRLEDGAMVLKPARTRLNVVVTHCGPEDSNAVYNLSTGPRYLRWHLGMQNPVTAAPLAGDKLNVVCPDAYERAAAWEFLSCPEKAGQLYSGYVRR